MVSIAHRLSNRLDQASTPLIATPHLDARLHGRFIANQDAPLTRCTWTVIVSVFFVAISCFLCDS